MKIHKLAALGVLPVLFFAGCTTTTGSSSLQREVDTLKMEVADLKDGGRLSDMRSRSGSSTDIYVEVGQLRSEVQRLTESVETASMGGMTLRQQLEYISARLDRLEKRANLKPLDTKVVAAVEPIPVITGGTVGGTVPPPPPVEDTASAPTTQDVTSTGTPPLPPAASGPYEDGKALFEQRNYQAAANQFRSYLSTEPKGSNASAAQFYIGESLYAQQQYEEAILEYQKVIAGFPKSSQVPTSLLKQGLSFQSMGDRDSAKLLYQKVVRDYPKSYAAGVAKERLNTI
ncbi:tol-pal system protein YbgF [Deltaproteobacteria bacterium Smac51]|nr:tol-pal system protein YbgF [Deltaproteobacteria bacterium Smac51]